MKPLSSTYRARALAAGSSLVVLLGSLLVPGSASGSDIGPPPTPLDWAAYERRADALRRELLRHGRRDTRNVALDELVSALPEASSAQPDAPAIEAVDGDPETAWRGAPGQGPWTYTLPFRRVVHLGLLRAHFGDDAARGVPGEYRWEYQPPVAGRCETWGLWDLVPGGRHHDRDGNEFLYGPRDVHAQRQVLFADVDACGIRLVMTVMNGSSDTPVLRELKVMESAPSLLRSAKVVDDTAGPAALAPSSPAGALDGAYETWWAGAAGAGPWALTIRLPTKTMVDRLSLLLGEDATTVPNRDGPGRRFSGAYLPTSYSVSTSADEDPAHFVAIPEAEAPRAGASALPVRRRLVQFAPRPVKLLRIVIRAATDRAGVVGTAGSAPVVRELGLYAADDVRPVVTEPLFLSVNANPAELTKNLKGGEATADGLFAREVHHRMRRIVVGFDRDSRWPAEGKRPRDASVGRYLEAIEGDDPTLARPLLAAMSPPPLVILSGSLDWEYDDESEPYPYKLGHFRWDVASKATDEDRGMGLLRDVVRARAAPFMGFCGGAQILALLAEGGDDFDRVLARNGNAQIRGLITQKNPYERAWWSDPPATDAARPVFHYDPQDPVFDFGGRSPKRRRTRAMPSSHGDMIRASALGGRLPGLRMIAHSDFCASWVDPRGPEPTFPDPNDPSRRCVRVPQAFRSVDADGYPIVGFQFHPEQRDLPRLAPGDPPEARADSLQVVANTLDLAIEAWLRLYWPWA